MYHRLMSTIINAPLIRFFKAYKVACSLHINAVLYLSFVLNYMFNNHWNPLGLRTYGGQTQCSVLFLVEFNTKHINTFVIMLHL